MRSPGCAGLWWQDGGTTNRDQGHNNGRADEQTGDTGGTGGSYGKQEAKLEEGKIKEKDKGTPEHLASTREFGSEAMLSIHGGQASKNQAPGQHLPISIVSTIWMSKSYDFAPLRLQDLAHLVQQFEG